ncbi:MAG: paraquat-inducible protein A [Gammaproteobacteria bacterium]|nr:MAG: paraquat-inducible protein A [Gammaproteobacteria bacterium]
MSSVRDLTLVTVIIIAMALLYPGLTRPVLTLTGTIDKADMVEIGIDLLAGEEEGTRKRQLVTGLSGLFGFDRVEGEMVVYQKTRSILGTVQELARTGNSGVAFLIVLFSVVIPLSKLLLQFTTLLLRNSTARRWLEQVIAAVSKWSMADVFVMALIVAYLAGSASEQMGDLMTMDAHLGQGFYWFLGYCLFSIASTVLVNGSNSVRRKIDPQPSG